MVVSPMALIGVAVDMVEKYPMVSTVVPKADKKKSLRRLLLFPPFMSCRLGVVLVRRGGDIGEDIPSGYSIYYTTINTVLKL